MFNSKYLIIFGVVLLVVAGGFLWYGRQVTAPVPPPESVFQGPTSPPSIKGPTEPPPQTAKTWTVTFTGSAFEPKEITIKKGDTVQWLNISAQSTWPASAIHPTHQVYPGFDALRGISTGETYSFTFDRVGSWRFHDHLHPSITGTVNVTE